MKFKLILKIIFLSSLFITIPLKAQNATFQWAKKISGPSLEYVMDVCTDSLGNIYSAGAFWWQVDFDPDTSEYIVTTIYDCDIFIQKMSPDGDHIWTKTMGGETYDYAHTIEIDLNGYLYIGGRFRDSVDFDPNIGVSNLHSNGNDDAFVIKMNTNGDLLWAKSVGGIHAEVITDISIDSNGNIYSVGNFHHTVDFDPGTNITQLSSYGNQDIFILKLDSNGNFIWTEQIGGISYESGNSIKTDLQGAIYITGLFKETVDFDPSVDTHYISSLGDRDGFILKLNTNGDFLWESHLSGFSNIYGNTITIDSNNNVYYAGSFIDTAYIYPSDSNLNITSNGGVDLFIQKLNTSGDVIWTNSLGGIGYENARSITINSKNELLLTGSFSSEMDFSSNVNNSLYTPPSGNESDVYILKLDTNGNSLWVKPFGGEDTDYGTHITTDINDNIITVGHFKNLVDFDPGLDVHNILGWGPDIFIHKLTNCEVYIIDTILSCSPYTWRDGNTYSTSNYYANHHIFSDNSCDTAYTLNLEIPVISTILNTAGTIITTNETSGDNYQWLDCNDNYSPIPNETSQTIFGEPGGSYAIQIIKNGCIDTSFCTTLVNFDISEQSFNALKLYPNPTKGLFSIINSQKHKYLHIRITSISGQNILTKTFSNTELITFELNQPNGMYMVDIYDDLNQHTRLKLIKH